MNRGVCAAFIVWSLLAGGIARTAIAAGASQLAPGETALHNGLTVAVRRAASSPTAAIEIWIACPSDGYNASSPGIARVSAFALAARKIDGLSLRDWVRADGGELTISVFPMATEFSLLVPSYVAAPLSDALSARVFHPTIDAASFNEGKARVSEQQVESTLIGELAFRDALFAAIFKAGPFHSSTYGDPQSLQTMTLADVKAFLARAYLPGNEIAVVVGNVDTNEAMRRIAVEAASVPSASDAGASSTNPRSKTTVRARQVDIPGVALGWLGPSIRDEAAATAMDFLSDYLTRSKYGLIAKAVEMSDPTANFSGQFITLREAGIFYASVSGEHADAAQMNAAINDVMRRVLTAPLPGAEFAQALDAFRTHLLRDTQSPQEIADNYGWYFVQGAPGYAPSTAGARLDGDYFSHVSALTPEFVFSIAKRYLSGEPTVILGGAHQRAPLPSKKSGVSGI